MGLGERDGIGGRSHECGADSRRETDWWEGNELLERNEGQGRIGDGREQTSNDWAYQFLTLLMEGMSPRLWGS